MEPNETVKTEDIKFDENGLIPAIVQDARTKRVLTLAYMNRESLEKTLETGETVFWSRSRQELWHKGDTSGNYQHVVSIIADCDRDALTVLVDPDGPACHLGTESCFEYPLTGEPDGGDRAFSLETLYELLEGRKREMPEGSYTSYLFDKGIDKMLKKLGEEGTEIIIAAKNPNPNEIVYEISDYLYHLMVVMAEKGITWEDVTQELARRQKKEN